MADIQLLGPNQLLSNTTPAATAGRTNVQWQGDGEHVSASIATAVTSVGLSLPSIFTVTVSPITTTGTLTAVLATQSANTFFAGPTTGAAATPTFRAMVAADLGTTLSPTFATLTITSTGANIALTDAVTSATATLASFLQTSLANGNRTTLFIGQALTTNNSSFIGHIPSATANQSLTTFGQFGAAELMVIRGDGYVGIGSTSITSRLHMVGASGTGAPAIGAGTLALQDSGASVGNGGSLLFGASQGFFAGIKGYISNGSNNTAGDLVFYTRFVSTDANLTEQMRLITGGIVSFASNIRLAVTTFANLPASPVAGQRGHISNSNSTTFAAAAAGGGANNVPVYYDGAAWRVG